jgi:hypothetical protein
VDTLTRRSARGVAELVLDTPNKLQIAAVLAAIDDCGTNGLSRAGLVDSTQYGVHLALLS